MPRKVNGSLSAKQILPFSFLTPFIIEVYALQETVYQREAVFFF